MFVRMHRTSVSSTCASRRRELCLRTMTFILTVLVPMPVTGARAREVLVVGVDHTPIVVKDLERAEADFHAMGFAIKPGRLHADGIRNAHVKFPDGTELELITAPAAVDPLTTEYFAKQQRSEGPIYFGLTTPDHVALAARLRALGAPVAQVGGLLTFPLGNPLHPLFFGWGEKAPDDRPEQYAHANSAGRVSGFWLRANSQERALFTGLGLTYRRVKSCGPLGVADDVILPRGDLLLVVDGPKDGAPIGVRIEVESLDAAAVVLKRNGFKPRRYPSCGALWLPPSAGHGIWLEFVQAG